MINQRIFVRPSSTHPDFDWRMNHDSPNFEYDFMLCMLGSRKEMIKDPNNKYRGGWLRVKAHNDKVREIFEQIDWLDNTFTTAVLQLSPWYVIELYIKQKDQYDQPTNN